MLDQTVEIFLSYKRLCAKSFGPNALKNLFVKATGQVELTSEGAAILNCLNQNHPIAHLIRETLTGFHSKYGDGTKTLLFLITETIAQIHQTLPKGQEAQQTEKLCCVRTLQHLQYSMIDHVLKNITYEEHKMEHGQLRDSTLLLLKNIIISKLHGSLSLNISAHFSDLLISLLKTNCLKEEDIADCFSRMSDNFQLIFVEQIGGMSLQSYVLDGVLLPRQFHDLASCPGGRLRNVCYLLIGFDFEIDEPDQNPVVKVTGKTNVEEILFWKSQLYSRLAGKFKEMGLNLIISSSRIPDQLALLFAKLKIYVIHFCPEKDLQRLAGLSDCAVDSDVQEILYSENSGHADSCVLTTISGKTCVQISGIRKYKDFMLKPGVSCANDCSHGTKSPEFSRDTKQISGNIIICAPSSGACQQIKVLLRNSCKLLAEAVQKDSRLSKDLHASTTHSNSHKISFVQGGGAFELAVYHLLSQLSGSSEDGSISLMLKMLARSYVTVPLTMMKNSHTPSASKSSIKDVLNLSQKPEHFPFIPQGIDVRHGARLLQSGDILEPLCLKVGQWHHLIMIVSQLLRIDTIVSVRRLLTKNVEFHLDDDDSD